MDWQSRLAALAVPFSMPGLVHAMAMAATFACLALIAAMLVQSRRHARLMRDLTAVGWAAGGLAVKETHGGAASGAVSTVSTGGASLEGIALSPIDRVFPRRPGQFLALVFMVSAGAWLTGYLLAPKPQDFLVSSEGLFMPFYVATHLITLRLFINVFTRNYAAGISHLDVSRAQALRGIRPILGLQGALAAALIAAPFCFFDFRYLSGPRYTPIGRDGIVRSIDYFMWSVWSVEWFVNALIWVLLVGFMIKNCLTLSRFPFRAPIDVVLHDKLYRPFLLMSAQGATVVLGFSCITVLYLVQTGGELTDYLGLGITVALLVICFVPPWLVLREKVARAVTATTRGLRQGAGLDAPAAGGFAALGSPGAKPQARSLEVRLDEALALLRIWHLQNLYGNLGQTEAKAILFRLLAPAATIGWQVANNYGDMTQRFAKFLAAMGVR